MPKLKIISDIRRVTLFLEDDIGSWWLCDNRWDDENSSPEGVYAIALRLARLIPGCIIEEEEKSKKKKRK